MSDPCECIFSHEALMRRLLSALRDYQSECTDTECTNPADSQADGGSNIPMLLLLWGVAAVVLFLTRPASMRNNNGDGQIDGKRPLNQNGSDRGPPPAL